MTPHQADIMALPLEERLEHALYIIDLLTGGDTAQVAWIMQQYRITNMQARLVLYLNAIHPRTASDEQILMAVEGSRMDRALRGVHVIVSHINKKNPGMIARVHNTGYYLVDKITVQTATPLEPAHHNTPWTPRQDEDLIRMVDSGSDMESMMYELERRERGITDRIKHLSREGRLK